MERNEEVKIGQHGFIRLLDVMGSDQDIEAAARVSYAKGTRKVSDTRGLIRYLMRKHHTSPFEMAELKFHIKAPIFVARQWVRHRTASWNEVSGRYSELPDQWWGPQEWRGQDTKNKQGSNDETVFHLGEEFIGNGGEINEVGTPPSYSAEGAAFREYRARLESGVSREMARSCLPLSTYTEWYWKIDLHNLLNFLRLRLDSHAQPEIREYAEPISGWVRDRFPLTWEAFVDYRMEAITFSKHEIRALATEMEGVPATGDGLSQGEMLEFREKCRKFFECGISFNREGVE